MSTLLEKLKSIKKDKDTNLTPEHLKRDVRVLGIDGTYMEAKEYTTLEDMNADTTAKEGDLAVVYDKDGKQFLGLFKYDSKTGAYVNAPNQFTQEAKYAYGGTFLGKDGVVTANLKEAIASGELKWNDAYRMYNSFEGITANLTGYVPFSGVIPSNVKLKGALTESSMSTQLFRYTTNSKLSFTGSDISGTTTIKELFLDSLVTEVNFKDFDTSEVIDMSKLFFQSRLMKPECILDLDTSKVENMSYMLASTPITIFPTSTGKFSMVSVKDISGMLYNTKISTFSDNLFKEAKPTNMASLFRWCKDLQWAYLNNVDTSRCTDMSYMFDSCGRLYSVQLGSKFDTSNVVTFESMFNYCDNLSDYQFSNYIFKKIKTTSNTTNVSSMFYCCKLMESADLSLWDFSNVTDMSSFLSGCNSLSTVTLPEIRFNSDKVNMSSVFSSNYKLTELDATKIHTENVTNMRSLFSDCRLITSLNISHFDTSKVTSMYDMFNGCYKLQSVDVSGFDTSNVTGMGGMFGDCRELKGIDVSGFDTSNVTDMSKMFYQCTSLDEVDVSGFDTSKVTNMSGMFQMIPATFVDVSGFDTSNVTNMHGMFSRSSITNVDISGFDTSNVTDMGSMFDYCKMNTLDLSNFNTSKVTTMSYMFDYSSVPTLINVSTFDMSNVKTIYRMFYSCGALTDIDVSNWNLISATNMNSAFGQCSRLTDSSLLSIIKALPTATSLAASNKTLKYIGLSQTQAEKCTTLTDPGFVIEPEGVSDYWQACLDAGWTTGY